MRVGDPEPWPELPPQDFARWWKQTGFRELRQILYWRWDPIGVSTFAFPATWDEYDSYAPQVAGLARKNASVDEISAYLRSVETDTIEMSTAEKRRIEVAQLVLDWYPESIDMWQDGRTTG